jgi:hypothetical protein
LDDLRDQLREIKDTIKPIIAEEPAGAFGLESLQISLTIGAQGKIWFKVSGSAEASNTLTFSRPSA